MWSMFLFNLIWMEYSHLPGNVIFVHLLTSAFLTIPHCTVTQRKHRLTCSWNFYFTICKTHHFWADESISLFAADPSSPHIHPSIEVENLSATCIFLSNNPTTQPAVPARRERPQKVNRAQAALVVCSAQVLRRAGGAVRCGARCGCLQLESAHTWKDEEAPKSLPSCAHPALRAGGRSWPSVVRLRCICFKGLSALTPCGLSKRIKLKHCDRLVKRSAQATLFFFFTHLLCRSCKPSETFGKVKVPPPRSQDSHTFVTGRQKLLSKDQAPASSSVYLPAISGSAARKSSMAAVKLRAVKTPHTMS